jgi:hypothetical protein
MGHGEQVWWQVLSQRTDCMHAQLQQAKMSTFWPAEASAAYTQHSGPLENMSRNWMFAVAEALGWMMRAVLFFATKNRMSHSTG